MQRQKFRTCGKCFGGRMTCTRCGGSGYIDNYLNKETCGLRGGSGQVTCSACGGTYKIWYNEEVPDDNVVSSYGGGDYSASGSGRSSRSDADDPYDLKYWKKEAQHGYSLKYRKAAKEMVKEIEKSQKIEKEIESYLAHPNSVKSDQARIKSNRKGISFKTIIGIIIVLWLLSQFFS